MAQPLESPMNSGDQLASVQPELRRIRRRRLLAHGPFLATFANALLHIAVSRAAPALASSANEAFEFSHAVLWGSCVVAFLFGGVAGLECPRCSELFHMGPKHRNDFARKCLWCDLRLDGSNAEESWRRRTW